MSVCRRSSDGQYFVQWKESGKVKRKYFGNKPDSELRATVFNNQVVQPNKAVKDILPVFTELANVYTTSKQIQMAEGNFYRLCRMLDGHIIPVIGDTRVDQLTHEQLDKYIVNRLSQGMKQNSVRKEIAVIKAVINWSVERKLILSNPILKYPLPKDDQEIIQPISASDVQAILRHSSDHLRRVILLAYYCGMRPGPIELFSMKYEQVNWDSREITIHSADKGGPKYRTVPIHSKLPLHDWFIQDGQKSDAYIIQWRGKPIRTAKQAFAKAKLRAGIPEEQRMPLYALRHTFITNLLRKKVDVYTISQLTGHNATTLLKHYAHSSNPVKIDAIDSIPDPEE